MRGQTYIISALVFALIVAIFAVINVEPVEVNYLITTGEVPLILVILISTLLGGLITGGFGITHLIRAQKQIKRLQQENTELRMNQSLEETDSEIVDANEIEVTNVPEKDEK